jgi:hypothetical protein
MAFDVNPRYLWLAISSDDPAQPMIVKVDLRTGAIAARVPFSAGPPIVGLAVFGETRPGSRKSPPPMYRRYRNGC